MPTRTRRTTCLIVGALALILAAGLLAILLFSNAGPRESSEQTVMVTMPDGIHLATDLVLPAGEGPWPVLLMRTLYGRDQWSELTDALIDAGVATVIQDVRGRHDSEGEFFAFLNDREDGPATIDWILDQPWSNDRLVTFGGSALGITQYMLAPGAPAELRCQWAQVAMPDLYRHAVYQNGVYRSELMDGWLGALKETQAISLVHSIPLNTADWDAARITGEYGQVNAAGMHVGGWYDIFARGTIEAFLGYQELGGPGAAGQQHLIMGPWTHNVNNPRAGELTFPAGVMADGEELMSNWLMGCLFDDAKGKRYRDKLDALPAVTYFTIGAVDEEGAPGNEWHTAENWPPAGNVAVPYYLLPDNGLGKEMPADAGGGDTIRYDPSDPCPTVGGANLGIPAGAMDQREIEQREDVIVYTTPALAEPLEITGDLAADIWIITDVPDTDIVVRLTDVYPDGRSMLIMDNIMRARYRASPDFTSESFLTPGEPARLTFDLGPTSYLLNAGHRLRVSVASSNASRFAPNPNTGAHFLEEGEAGQIAHTTILHDAAHPSAIILPLARNID